MKPLEVVDVFDRIQRAVNFLTMLKQSPEKFPCSQTIPLFAGGTSSDQKARFVATLITRYALAMDAFAEAFYKNGVTSAEIAEVNKQLLSLGVKTKLYQVAEQYKAVDDLGMAFRRAANAGDLESMKILSKCVDINEQGGASLKTALHFAVQAGKVNAVEFLLKAGANPDLQDKDGKRPADLTQNQTILKLFSQQTLSHQ